MELLTKSATTGDIQVTYMHASIGKKSLGETITALSLMVSLKAPTVVLIDIKHTFAGDVKNICLLTTEVLLRAASGNL